ncbi:hypothetical protein [Candidatus Poriferisodalis sp.]
MVDVALAVWLAAPIVYSTWSSMVLLTPAVGTVTVASMSPLSMVTMSPAP